eukprot:m.46450 g.46450  ORF g.46450 m.46450 type:complete len:486 (-) comp13153_c0_seq1:112-1569(-)
MATASKAKTDVAKDDKMETEVEEPVDEAKLTVSDIANNIGYFVKAVDTQEPRYSFRALRKLNTLRKKLTAEILQQAIATHYPASGDADVKEQLSAAVGGSSMDSTTDDESTATKAMPVEAELYLQLLVAVFLMDSGKLAEAEDASNGLLERLDQLKRRSSHVLGARAFFIHARIHELRGTLSATRPMFQRALRKATLQTNELGQAVIINALLRSFVQDKLYDQADLLVGKTTFPESTPNQEAARYQYYLGRIKAVQLDYTEAYQHLIEASRKAPAGATGFLQAVFKMAVIVQLLTGEIPDRDLFRRAYLKKSLGPYFALTCAVRTGDVKAFNTVVADNQATFLADETMLLIQRLRHSVIKTGVRKMSVSYSRISLADLASKLSLDTPEEAEYIVAKAIRDGVIDAVINHEEGYLSSKEVVDIYSTGAPQEAFHQRINFCLKIHRDSVKAMRYAPTAYRKHLISAEELEAEIAEAELAEDDAEEEL